MVTRRRISFRTSLFFCKLDFRSVNLTSEVIFFYEIVRVTSSEKVFFEVVDVLIEGFSPGEGGHLGIFWVGMCRPRLQIGTPFKKKISPKIDTPF